MINDLYELLKSVTSLDVYYGYLPVNEAINAAVFSIDNEDKSPTFDGVSSFVMTDITIDVWGKDPAAVESNLSGIVSALEGQRLTQGSTTFYNFVLSSSSSSFEPENNLFKKSIGFIAHHN